MLNLKKRGTGAYGHAGDLGDVDSCITWDSEKKGADLGGSTCGSALSVPEPGDSQPKFLTHQKFI